MGPVVSYLTESIVYGHPEIEVHGISRWHSTTASRNLVSIEDRLTIHECDLNDFSSILNVFGADLLFEKPEVSSMSQFNFYMLSDRWSDVRQGTSAGVFASFIFSKAR